MSSYTYREKSFECAFCGAGTILTNDQNQTEFHADLPYKWLKSLDGYACTKSQCQAECEDNLPITPHYHEDPILVILTLDTLTQIILPYRAEALKFMSTLKAHYSFILITETDEIPKSLIDLDHFEDVLGFYYDVEDEDDSSEFKTLEFIHQFKMFNPYGDHHETN